MNVRQPYVSMFFVLFIVLSPLCRSLYPVDFFEQQGFLLCVIFLSAFNASKYTWHADMSQAIILLLMLL